MVGCGSGTSVATPDAAPTVTPAGNPTSLVDSSPTINLSPAGAEQPTILNTPAVGQTPTPTVVTTSPITTPTVEPLPPVTTPTVEPTPPTVEPAVSPVAVATPIANVPTDNNVPADDDTTENNNVGELTRANYESILNQALGIFAGQSFGLELMELPEISERRYQQFPAIVGEDSLMCNNGGRIDVTGENPVPFQSIYNYSFVDCTDGDTEISGPLFRQTDSQRIVWSSGFSQERPEDAIEFDGGANFLFMNQRGGSASRVWSTNELNLSLQNDNGEFTVSESSTFFETVEPLTAFLSGSFNYSSALTGGQTMRVSVTEDFVYSDLTANFNSPDWRFTSGALSISAENGDSIMLRADTGDFDTVDIEINNASGQEVFTQSWSDFVDSLEMPTDFEPDFAE